MCSYYVKKAQEKKRLKGVTWQEVSLELIKSKQRGSARASALHLQNAGLRMVSFYLEFNISLQFGSKTEGLFSRSNIK